MVRLQSRTLRKLSLALCVAALVPAGANAAQDAKKTSATASDEKPATNPPSKPVTNTPPNAQQVAETPLTDLNVKKGEIPPILLRAQANPYSLSGLRSCPAIIREVGGLNAVLGDDVDIASARKKGLTAGGVAQSVVGSLIPFRSVVRELSGANAEQRRLEAVIRAGMARRGFLKGVGLSRGCHYPARPG